MIGHSAWSTVLRPPGTGRPALSHPRGEGVFTGPHTKSAGLRVVAEMAQKISIPIIGNGGVCSGQDVIVMEIRNRNKLSFYFFRLSTKNKWITQ